MQSGIFDYTKSDDAEDDVDRNPNREWGPSEVIEYVRDQPASFYPGTDFEYSNTNYVLLELIVENVTGTTLAQALRSYIYSPLGLDIFMDRSAENSFGTLTTRGYDRGDDVTSINDQRGLGDGGVISNAKEVGGFLWALFSDQTILNSQSLSQMRQFDPHSEYGLGLETVETVFGEAWGHSGASSGYSGDMLYLPGKDTVIVVLTNNVDSEVPEEVEDSLLEIFWGE